MSQTIVLDRLMKSNYWISHLSDVLRYVLLYKFGGIYLDLDVMVLNGLQHYNNFVVTEPGWRSVKGLT